MSDKKRIRVDGQFVEVSDAIYEAYIKGDRKERYMEVDLKTERILLNKDGTVHRVMASREDSMDRLMENGQQFTADEDGVEDKALRNVMLYQALDTLSEAERKLIDLLYFQDKTERAVAKLLGKSQPAIHAQNKKIIEKLRKFFSE